MKVYVDLDGVLFDLEGGYFQATGVPFRSIENAKERWDKLKGLEVGFYEGLLPFHGAKEFVEAIMQSPIPEQTGILSALPSMLPFPTAYNEKIRAVKKHIHPYMPIYISQSSMDKWRYCEKGDILIDDNALNISQWNSAGGIGILHHSFKKSLEELEHLL